MSQAMYTAMTGINAGQETITVVSDNIANLNTTAFKESAINFQDVWYKTYTSGTAPTYTAGGTNSKQVGVGTLSSSITKNFDTSSINTTGKTSDMAIEGDGFFTIRDANGALRYTRDGNFTLDSNGYLVTSSGYNVLGTEQVLSYSASTVPVKIPQSLELEPVAQPAARFQTKTLDETNNAQIIAGDFSINIIKPDGTTGSATLTIGNPTETTIQKMVADFNTQLTNQNMPVSCVIKDGVLQFQINKDPDTGADLVQTMSFKSGTSNFVQTTDISWASKVPATATTNSYYSTKILDYNVTIDPVSAVDRAVTLESWSVSETGIIEATYSNGDKITVYKDEDDDSYKFKYTMTNGVEIIDDDVKADPNALIPGNMQMQFANVTNNQGLVAVGSNMYATGPNSGPVSYAAAGNHGIGSVATGGLESSNVDMSRQFSTMLLAQRGIEANSRVFDTANSILQTLVYLGRG